MSVNDYPAQLLSSTERRLIRVCRTINENWLAKRIQRLFVTQIGQRWVHGCTRNRLDVDGIQDAVALAPERGVLVCSNHRSYFDMYVILAALLDGGTPWIRDQYFPVRTDFFYESWTGLAVNLVMSGGSMYPPIFRERERSSLNRFSVEQIVGLLQNPGTVVGVHPEGSRSKGPDPLALLRAQPGVGQMALQADVPVLPIWIDGLGNNLPQGIATNFRPSAAAQNRIVIRVGAPVDLSDFSSQRPRLTLYKRAADRIMEHIAMLGRNAPRSGSEPNVS